MRMVVRGFALLLLLATLLTWGALGAHTGWTMTSVAEVQIDPVTELEYTTYRDAFVPGMEFLALGVFGAVIIFAATLFVPITPTSKS